MASHGARWTVAEMSVNEAFEEIQEILREVASLPSPSRLVAVRYTQCRSVLLGSVIRPALPGFLIQCVSAHKFHDFINLYHADLDARLAFISGAFRETRSLVNRGR